MPQKICILDKDQAERKLLRIAYEIYERNIDLDEVIFVGIKNDGLNIAGILKNKLQKISDIKVSLCTLSINKEECNAVSLDAPMDLHAKTIVLIDDVANSGRTLLYSLEPIMQQRPKAIQLAVLVNRMHKSFPIHPDYVGLDVATTLQDHIVVESTPAKVLGAYLI